MVWNYVQNVRMRRPSENLMQRLRRLCLITAQDVAACEPIVKRLCQNLPEFDTVWIDALVQRRMLTPWQAGILESPTPESLRVDDFCKIDQPGRHTFQAISETSGRQVVLKRMQTPLATDADTEDWHTQTIDRIRDVRTTAPTGIGLPRGTVGGPEDPGERYIASDFVPGWTAEELLIRGGRIPWQAVAEIGQQLLSGIQWLDRQNLIHGDVALQNVRLRPDGVVVLVGGVTLSAHTGGLSLTSDLRLKDVLTAAPERFGTGAPPDTRGDLYAVGCVLWQLLSARPTFLSADPVTKILKSQEHDVDDVRKLVTDCPDWMARSIQCMTRRTPELRPASGEEFAVEWKRHAGDRTNHTRRLLKRLPDRARRSVTHVPGSPPVSLVGRLAPGLAAILMIGGFAAYGIQRGLIPTPLAVVASQRSDVTKPMSVAASGVRESTATVDVRAQNGSIRMPQPDAAGVVVLRSGESYSAGDLECAGIMHIETTSETVALVQVDGSNPWRLTAGQIVMRNVHVRRNSASLGVAVDAGDRPLIECECDVLSVDRCRLDSGQGSNRDRSLSWTARTGRTSVVSISNSVLQGTGYGLWLTSVPERCRLENLLITTHRAAIRCDVDSRSEAVVRLNASRVTQVGSFSFLDVVVQDSGLSELRVQLTSGESVLAVSTTLIQIAGPASWPLRRSRIECLLPERGNPTIVPPDVLTAVGFDSGLKSVVALQDSQIQTEGLLIANPEFQGQTTINSSRATDAAYTLLDYEGPKLSQQLPGVDVDALPKPHVVVITSADRL